MHRVEALCGAVMFLETFILDEPMELGGRELERTGELGRHLEKMAGNIYNVPRHLPRDLPGADI